MTLVLSICCFSALVVAIEMSETRVKNEKGVYLLAPSDSDYQEFLWKAVKHINDKINGDNLLVPVNVSKAEMLLVSGSLFTFEIELAESNNLKKNVTHEQLKRLPTVKKEGGQSYIYKIKIWSQPWQDFEEYTVLNSKKL
ncbi:hypothetical protein L596_013871 [Steinernema carpocapsae]|uniref:Cystatin domain-containing protein n=1 Tax=Steinernema carpocapsae TaxID=34508 RepID=A0A4U5P1H8_STECR|nr:hypothetical protein L596_013871 [Steinernema carpocapsae]